MLLTGITVAAGYRNNVAGVGIEPIGFDETDVYPQIVVQEDDDAITDSNASGFEDSAVFRIAGFFPIKTTQTPMRAGHILRADITRALARVTRSDFLDDNGNALINSYALTGQREIDYSAADSNFMEVAVRVSIDCRDFPTPLPGNN